MCYFFLGNGRVGIDGAAIYSESDKQLFISRTHQKAREINAEAILFILEGFFAPMDAPIAVMETPLDNVAPLSEDLMGIPCIMVFGVCRGMNRGLSWTIPFPNGGHAPRSLGEAIETDSFWVKDVFV